MRSLSDFTLKKKQKKIAKKKFPFCKQNKNDHSIQPNRINPTNQIYFICQWIVSHNQEKSYYSKISN